MSKYKVLDTNIILLAAENILTLAQDGSTIVLPEVVVDEIDSKKGVLGEIGYQAREFSRMMANATRGPNRVTGAMKEHIRFIDGVRVIVASLEEYPDFKYIDEKNLKDMMIVHIAKLYYDFYGGNEVEFISNDMNCGIKASFLGIPDMDLKEVETTSFEFVKHLEVSREAFGLLHKKPIISIDPDYKPENYSYVFTCPELGYDKLGYVSNGLVDIFGKETESDLSRQALSPINVEQKFFSKAILDPAVPIVVCEALSGSGKTAIAISSAMKLIGKNSPYKSLIYIRASVDDTDKVESVGFLPGLEEKFAVYLHPIEDVLESIARNDNKKSQLKGDKLEDKIIDDIQKMKDDYNIQMMTTLGLRGRTLSDAVVIIDEAQNQSKPSMQKTLTRFGKNVKVIIIGSNRQIDNAYLTKYTNGLSTILEDCSKADSPIKKFAINLHKVVRSPLSEWAEALFSK